MKNPLWFIFWLIVLIFIAFFVAGFCAGWYILLYPLTVCFPGISGLTDFLLTGIQFTHYCADSMMQYYEDGSEQKSVDFQQPPISPKNQSSRKHQTVPTISTTDRSDKETVKMDDVVRTEEEKRRHIIRIIDKIPTHKADLFSYKLDETEIRPWINKKIIEYIGEPEPTLVDFICSKVLAGSTPQGILDDVQVVLGDEAEVFVVKMWRLLIYEVEAKKGGIGK